jgi:4-hydroxythreonine-4-phosphate dehydrogenase
VTHPLQPIVLTSGEPAGIGPDVCAALACEALPLRWGALGDPDVLRVRCEQLRLTVRVVVREAAAALEPHRPGVLQVLPVHAPSPVEPGRLDPRNADYVLEQVRTGVALCVGGECGALVTAPVHKSVINDAGIAFSGHTELLAELTGSAQPVMMLASPALQVALATTHLPLRRVADTLSQSLLTRVLTVLHDDLESRFGIDDPRVLVLGLNPHAGEGGALGDEEIRVIAPVIDALSRRGHRLVGPVSADTAFTAESLERCDVVLAMYHDQGLPVLKTQGFGEIVNVTLGLPIVRTSVDHGTALALAGTGRAKHGSLRAAVEMAAKLALAPPR